MGQWLRALWGLLSVALVALVSSSALAQSGLFRAAFETFVPARGSDIGVVDADSDGVDDVVLATGRGVYVLTGRPEGAIDPAFRLRLRNQVTTLTLGDIVGDPAVDFVATVPVGRSIEVWRGLGTGDDVSVDGTNHRYFAPVGTPLVFASVPLATAVGDFDDDGSQDIAVSVQGFVDLAPGTVEVFLGDGAGGLEAKSGGEPLETGLKTEELETVDVDGDGVLDLIGLDIGDSSLRVFLGNGDGTFASPVVSVLPSIAAGMAVAEMDGTVGFEVAVSAVEVGGVSIFDLLDDGTIASRVSLATGAGPADVSAGDVDGDGDTDLLVANRRSSDVAIVRDPLSAPLVRRFVAGDEPRKSVPASILDRGVPSLVAWSGASSTSVQLLLPRFSMWEAGGVWAAENHPAAEISAIAVGDIDSNGEVDVVVAAAAMVIAYQRQSTGFVEVAAVEFESPVTSLAVLPTDAAIRIATAVEEENVVRILEAEDGRLRAVQALALPFPPSVLAAGDFNGDGRADLSIGGSDGVGRVAVARANAAGDYSLQGVTSHGANPRRLASIRACSGPDELIVLDEESAQVSVLRSSPSGGLVVLQVLTEEEAGLTPTSLAVADFNEDGREDLAIGNAFAPDNRTLRIALGDCTTPLLVASAASGLQAGGAVQALVAMDVDGDSMVDIVAVNSTENLVRTFLGTGVGGDGSPRFSARSPDRVSRQPEAIVAADVDGDGLYDVLTANVAPSGQNFSNLLGCSAEESCHPFQGPIGVRSRRGDGNGDGVITAADFVALVQELSDGDTPQVEAATREGYPTTLGVDGDGDTRVNLQDVRAVSHRLFGMLLH